MDVWISMGLDFQMLWKHESSHAHKHGVQVIAIGIHEMNHEHQK